MIIKCLQGSQLELTKKRLTEISDNGFQTWYVNLKEWAKSPNSFKVRATDKSHSFHPGHEGGFSIGCRHFSKETYDKILKAAGVKPVRKTKPVKKARRAKN